MSFELTYWTWLIVGVVLIIIELFAPAAFFLWMGISAILTGGLLWVFDSMLWTTQVLIFSVLSIASIFLWKKFFKIAFDDSDQPLLNKRTQQFLGRVLELEQPIKNGIGSASIDDSKWRLLAEKDYPQGTRVKVVSEDGVNLKVEQVD